MWMYWLLNQRSPANVNLILVEKSCFGKTMRVNSKKKSICLLAIGGYSLSWCFTSSIKMVPVCLWVCWQNTYMCSFDLHRRFANQVKLPPDDEQVILLCNSQGRRNNRNASNVLPVICLLSYVLALEANHSKMSDLVLRCNTVHSHLYI